jgi:hypothetical protein
LEFQSTSNRSYYIDKNRISQSFSLAFYGFYSYNNPMSTINNSKSKGGRPPKSPEELRTEDLLVKLKTDEKEAFKHAADLAGVSLSTWVRERLRWAATKELQNYGREVPFLQPI